MRNRGSSGEYEGLFAGVVNEISAITVTDKHFDYETMERNANIWVTELLPDKIKVYRKLKGSKKPIFKDEVTVDEGEMKNFFCQVFDFVRNADYEDILIDDTDHRTVIFYNIYHKEVFDNDLYKGGESLLTMIDRFAESKGVTTFEECMRSMDN